MTINGPLDLTEWTSRLTNMAPGFRSVGLAADLQAAQVGTRSTPQGFVIQVSDTPSARPGSGNSVVSQNVNSTIAVVIAAGNQRGSATGSEASVDLRALRRQIMDALIGWTPPGADTGIQYSGGQLLAYGDSTVWWSDRYTTSYFVRKEFTT